MEEIKYNFFERIMHSIKTGNFYLDIRKEELSRAIKYFLLLAFILTTASFINSLILQKSDIFPLIYKLSVGGIVTRFIIGILIYIAGKLINLLFASLIGMIVNAIEKTKLTYSAIFKTSAYVMTLPLILKTILELANITIPFYFFFNYSLIVFYLFKTLRLSSDEVVIESEQLLN